MERGHTSVRVLGENYNSLFEKEVFSIELAEKHYMLGKLYENDQQAFERKCDMIRNLYEFLLSDSCNINEATKYFIKGFNGSQVKIILDKKQRAKGEATFSLQSINMKKQYYTSKLDVLLKEQLEGREKSMIDSLFDCYEIKEEDYKQCKRIYNNLLQCFSTAQFDRKCMFINIPAKEMCYDMEKDKFEKFLQLINPYGIKYKADKQSRINGMTREAGYFNYLMSNRQDLSDEETELRDRIKDWSVNGTSLVDENLEKGQAEEIEDLQEKIRELENKVSQQSQEIEAQEKQLDKLNFEIETYERNEKYLRGEIEKAKGQEVKEQPADKLNRSVVNKMVELYENNMTLEVYEKLIRIYAEKSGRELNR